LMSPEEAPDASDSGTCRPDRSSFGVMPDMVNGERESRYSYLSCSCRRIIVDGVLGIPDVIVRSILESRDDRRSNVCD
jgi:hypothetical protein